MESLTALVFSSGWASGINAYATVAVLGLVDRFSDTLQSRTASDVPTSW